MRQLVLRNLFLLWAFQGMSGFGWVGGWDGAVKPLTPEATSQTLVVIKKSKNDFIHLLLS